MLASMPQTKEITFLCNSRSSTYQSRNEDTKYAFHMRPAVSPRRTPLLPVSIQSPSPGAVWPVHLPKCLPNDPQDVDTACQWVLADMSVESCSSPEVLHICDTCDAEFSTISDLTKHSRMCKKRVKIYPQFSPLKYVGNLWRPPLKRKLVSKSRGASNFRQTKQLLTENRNGKINRKPPRSCMFETPDPPIVITLDPPVLKILPLNKHEFLERMGLKATSDQSHTSPKPKSRPPLSSNIAHTLYRKMPFSLLPKEFWLRSNSFYASHRVQQNNLDLIYNNWKKMDKVCPAYPANHKKFQDFSQLQPPPLRVVEESTRPKKGILGDAALALNQESLQPRLVLPRLTAHEIRLAQEGRNTQALLVKYSPSSKQHARSRRLILRHKKLAECTSPSNSSATVSRTDGVREYSPSASEQQSDYPYITEARRSLTPILRRSLTVVEEEYLGLQVSVQPLKDMDEHNNEDDMYVSRRSLTPILRRSLTIAEEGLDLRVAVQPLKDMDEDDMCVWEPNESLFGLELQPVVKLQRLQILQESDEI